MNNEYVAQQIRPYFGVKCGEHTLINVGYCFPIVCGYYETGRELKPRKCSLVFPWQFREWTIGTHFMCSIV